MRSKFVRALPALPQAERKAESITRQELLRLIRFDRPSELLWTRVHVFLDVHFCIRPVGAKRFQSISTAAVIEGFAKQFAANEKDRLAAVSPVRIVGEKGGFFETLIRLQREGTLVFSRYASYGFNRHAMS
jgi:hypothetical protein